MLASATTEENIDSVHHMLINDMRLAINQIANALILSCMRDQNILDNEVAMSKVSASEIW